MLIYEHGAGKIALLLCAALLTIASPIMSVHGGTQSSAIADGCRYVFLDVGANIGVNNRFLFEISKYPAAVDWMTFLLGGMFPSDRRRSDVCAYAFEPNPAHAERLSSLSSHLSKHGFRFRAMNVGAGAANTRLTFYKNLPPDSGQYIELFASKVFFGNPNKLRLASGSNSTDILNFTKAFNHNEEMFSVEPHPFAGSSHEEFEVDVIDFGAWVSTNVIPRSIPPALYADDPPPAVVMKMDIEGSEFAVLTSLLFKGALCRIDRIVGEWAMYSKFGEAFTFLTNYSRGQGVCTTKLIDSGESGAWDEPYAVDPIPL